MEDDDPSDAVTMLVASEHGGSAGTDGLDPKYFNLSEFLALANRVVDDGDVELLAALHSLKQHLVAKYGDGDSPTSVMSLKPVASRQPTPFPLPVRVLRRAIRSIITALHDRELALSLLLANPNAEHGPFVVVEAPPPRVLEAHNSPRPIDEGGVIIGPRPNDVAVPMGVPPAIVHDPAPMSRPDDGKGGIAYDSRPTVAAASANFIPVTASTPTPHIYVGNVPLTMTSHCFDKIAEAFHNSSRKTLSFVPPTMQNGEIVIWPSLDVIRDGSIRWSTMAVGYFLGKKPYFHHINEFARSLWLLVREVKATSNDFYFFEFKTMAAMEEVIEGGPWLFRGQPIVLQKWEPGMMLRKLQHTQVPVWIKLRYLPVELWTTEGLSTVASGIGKPLYPDAITRACTRLDFARVYVMLDISLKLPKHIVLMVPCEDGSESACKVDVEYEWLPSKCNACMSLGHPTKEYPSTKPKQPPVSVYVQKSPAVTQVRRESREHSAGSGTRLGERKELGKAIVLYNAFNALMVPDSDTETSKGRMSSPTPNPDD
ncbi:UNVERIFIED_CONTAM: hypothetical protein Slati_4223500 [Sesamum latifolium]|uniref:DUF4283 domain-containing protein n=1 Tax=Sesamum latifolium TaxID=2727402 RepID=A0AAW2TDZ0_9LAMI